MQELDSRAIAQAILDARWRGVDVDIFLEQDYLRTTLAGQAAELPDAEERRRPPRRRCAGSSGARTTPTSPRTGEILAALLRSDVEVKGDFNPKIFHQKFILRDYRGGKARPDLGAPDRSANFTTTDTHRNLNHVFVFHNA